MNPYITKPIHRELLSTASLGDIWYLIFQQRPQWAPKYALANSRKSVFPTRESKERCNSARWIQSRKAVSQIAFFMAFIEGIIWFWQQELMGFEMSSHTFYKKSISNLLNHTHTQTNKQANKQTTGSTLGDKPRHHEAVSFNDIFSLVFVWGYSVFHHRPQGLPDVPLESLQRECLQPA